MSCDQSYPFPQVFLVDGGPHHSEQPPNLIPCWSFPPAQERMRSREKSRGCMGISPSLAMIVLMLFLLVFAALGFEAYQILDMQKKMKDMGKVEPKAEPEFSAPLKQIGLYEPRPSGEDKRIRPAAHVIGRIEKEAFPNTLRWEPKTGQAFTSGGVAYITEDGALQVNETGLYHIYSRVELIFKECPPTSSFQHSVFVKRAGHASRLNLMEAHRVGFCPQHASHSWTTESYLSSAQQLKRNDKVFVNVSQPRFLSHSHYANFFGLYKI
ncbi:tumor necrosis factor ligand superfamily member 6 [Odontesthes bonariensis]|uniref:tumor necrosis factor ligand superfamily member 6 n=1 Tax=Odontesthes bonariensis TaxID=219752 RepID=UPI003F58599D